MPDAGGAGGIRVGVAFNDAALEPSPTWTYLTATEGLVAGYEKNVGRSSEFDRVDTGTCVVTIVDREGVLDPTNSAGPYYGLIQSNLQIQVELLNPVDDTYYTRFRGHIDEYDYDVDDSTHLDVNGDPVGVNRLQIECVDLFGAASAIEMQPDLVSGAPAFGDTVPLGSEGKIFFQNATVKDRIEQVLTNANWPDEFAIIFTGNVWCSECTYEPSDTVMQVIQEAADAEFPTVANVFCDRLGRLVFHGRLAKFDPEGTAAGATPGAWDFHDWYAGDEEAVLASAHREATAQIRKFGFNRGRPFIRNYALCTPDSIRDEDVPDQVSRDDASIGQHGYCSWSAENLKIAHPTAIGYAALTTAGASILTGNSALDECQLYADFITANYPTERDRVTTIEFRSMRPTDPRAEGNWALLAQGDLGDRVNVTIKHPGGGGFNAEPYFIEGIREVAEPLDGHMADVTLNLDLSPAAWFTPGAWSGVS
jgi:hypothetical protein